MLERIRLVVRCTQKSQTETLPSLLIRIIESVYSYHLRCVDHPLQFCMRISLIAFLVLISTVMSAEAGASASLLGASPSYSAVREVVVDGRFYTGKVFHVAGKERDEQEIFGIPEVIILNGASDKGWVIVPMMSTFVEFSFPPVMTKLADSALKKTQVAIDNVDGVPAIRYYVNTTSSDGTNAKGFLWYSRRGVLVKLQGVIVTAHGHRMTVAMRLSHIEEGPQDKSLFAIPAGFTRLPAEALAPLLGGTPSVGRSN
jgi:hypothetical protein